MKPAVKCPSCGAEARPSTIARVWSCSACGAVWRPLDREDRAELLTLQLLSVLRDLMEMMQDPATFDLVIAVARRELPFPIPDGIVEEWRKIARIPSMGGRGQAS